MPPCMVGGRNGGGMPAAPTAALKLCWLNCECVGGGGYMYMYVIKTLINVLFTCTYMYVHNVTCTCSCTCIICTAAQYVLYNEEFTK